MISNLSLNNKGKLSYEELIKTVEKQAEEITELKVKIKEVQDKVIRIRDKDGSEVEFDSCSDIKLEDFIKQQIPENTYTNVSVKTEKHAFFGSNKEISARYIQINRTESYVTEVFKSFFSVLFNSNSTYTKPIGETSLLTYILNSSDIEEGGKDEKEKRIKSCNEDIKAVYHQCKNIHIWIPTDFTCKAHINLSSESGVVTFSIESGKILTFLIPNFLKFK